MRKAAYRKVTNDPYMLSGPAGDFNKNGLSRDTLNNVHYAALELAANEIDKIGCMCYIIEVGDGNFSGTIANHSYREVLIHDNRCPIVLATKIREGLL